MGLTRIAQDPWSETHTVPTFTPLPVDVKSCHVPLTAERAEEMVKTHIERTNSRHSSNELPNETLSANNAVCVVTASSPSEQLRTLGPPALGPSDAHDPGLSASSRTVKKSTLLQPLGSFRPWVARTDDGDVGAPSPASDDAKELLDPWALSSPEPTTTDFSFEAATAAGDGGGGGGDEGISPNAAASTQLPRVLSRHPSRPSPPPSASTNLTLSPISRRLSCPEALLRVPPNVPWTSGATEDGGEHPAAAPRVEDALAPLANPHTWMKDREPVFNDGSLGLLYSAASVLQVGGGARGGGWQPQDAAGIFSLEVLNAWDDHEPRSRLRVLIQSGASPDAIRTLAAIIIQSYCRGWRARRHAAHLRAVRAGEASAAQDARKAAEALAREQAEVRRKLRMAAKDCLFALHAQSDYERTRSRMQAAQRLGPSGGLSPPPPPALPTIPQALWARCIALGQDPIQVLLDCGMLSQQIEQIVNASKLASQVPRRTTGSSHVSASDVADADVGDRVSVGVSGDSRVRSSAVSLGSVVSLGLGSSLALTAEGAVSSSLSAPSLAGVVGTAAVSTETAKAAAAPTRRMSLPGRMGLMGLRASGAGCKPGAGVSTAQIMEPGSAGPQLQPQPPPYPPPQHLQHQMSLGLGSGGLSVGPRRSIAASMSGALPPPSPPPAPPPPAALSSWRHTSPNRNPHIAAETSRASNDTAAAGSRGVLGALVAASVQLLPSARSSSGQLPYNALSSPGLPPAPQTSTSLKNMPTYSNSFGASGAARRRVSDFSGVGGNGNASASRSSSGGALALMGAVGISPVATLPGQRGTTLRSRSHGSESGALLQMLQQQATAGPAQLPAQPSMPPARLVLPAVQQSSNAGVLTQQASPNRAAEEAVLRRRHSLLNSYSIGGASAVSAATAASAASLAVAPSQGGGPGPGSGSSAGLGDAAAPNAAGLFARVSGTGYGTSLVAAAGGAPARSPTAAVGGGTAGGSTSANGDQPCTLPPLLQPVSPGSLAGGVGSVAPLWSGSGAASPSYLGGAAAGGVMGGPMAGVEGTLGRGPLRRVSSQVPSALPSGLGAAAPPPPPLSLQQSSMTRRQRLSVAGSGSLGAAVAAAVAVGASVLGEQGVADDGSP